MLTAQRLCVLVLALTGITVSAQNSGEEYRLKAAFVYRFPQFVEWPEAALSKRSSIELCVERPNPFGRALKELTSGESLHGRPIVVREIESERELASCHVLFVPKARRNSPLMARAAARSILTVGESPDFLDDGGIIRLRLVDRRVRFDVNVRAAHRVNLILSSQLLRLASEVRGEP